MPFNINSPPPTLAERLVRAAATGGLDPISTLATIARHRIGPEAIGEALARLADERERHQHEVSRIKRRVTPIG